MAQPPSNPPPQIPPWPEKDELSLLAAVLEISKEPAESYNPRINLFDRIGENLKRSFTNKEVLGKIKELKERYEKKCRGIRNGENVKRTAAFEISEKIWGDGMKKKAAQRPLQDIESHHAPEVKSLEAAKPTVCVAETNPHEASKPKLKRAREPTKKGTDVRSMNKNKKKKGNPSDKKQKDKAACFICGNPGHFARDCLKEKKIAKKPTKQQKTREISKGTAGLQLEMKNKREEQSSALISARFRPGSHQLTRQHTQQRVNVSNNFQPRAHQPKSKQRKVVNIFQPSAHQLSPRQLNRGSPLPRILPPPATWRPHTPIATPFPPPPPIPYRRPPPYPMNYSSPPNYPMFNRINTNNSPNTTYNPSPAENSMWFAHRH